MSATDPANPSRPSAVNAYEDLRQKRLAEATREFLARGKSLRRCARCQLGDFACICPWRPTVASRCEFVLLMHRNELFKPTNTGRLIADALPANTRVFCWSRTEPAAELLGLLRDPQRQCLLVFPCDESEARERLEALPVNQKIPTFILLDGTWKQSGRMFHLSQWLKDLPCLLLPQAQGRGYSVRKSHQANYLSTAEAAALCLQLANEPDAATTLQDYFQLFNLHYVATRACAAPAHTELHARLSAAKNVLPKNV